MRRTILFVVIFLFILTACGQAAPPPAPAQFTSQAQVTFGEDEFAAKVAQSRPGVLEVTFTAPAEIAGMELLLQGTTATLQYHGMQTELPQSALPISNFAVLLNTVLLQLAQESAPKQFASVRDGSFTLQGSASGLAYQATVAENGMLITMEVPGIGLQVLLDAE